MIYCPQNSFISTKKTNGVLEEGYPVDHKILTDIYSGLGILHSKKQITV